jgi:enoyl-CoA hydratase/carnithine racemase
VCTGAGEHFSSGVDLDDLADPVRSQVFRDHIERPEQVRFTSRDCAVRKPVIAAVNGLCVGGAFMWVVAADFAIAAEDAQFVDPHTSLGQTVGRGTLGMVAHTPFGAAIRMTFTGRNERLSAQTALRLGLVTDVVETGRLQAEAQRVAEIVAKNSPAALAASKRALWRMLQLGLDEGCQSTMDEIVSMWSHPDQREGPACV